MHIGKLKELSQKGDVVLIGSRHLLSRLIRYAQKPITGKPSDWNHVMLVYDKCLFLESALRVKNFWRIDNGVQYTKFETYKRVKNAVLLKPPISDLQRTVVVNEGMNLEEKGIAYPVNGLFLSLIAYWLTGGKISDYVKSSGLYCSAFIQDCYNRIGIDFSSKYDTTNTAPEHIWQYALSNQWEIVRL